MTELMGGKDGEEEWMVMPGDIGTEKHSQSLRQRFSHRIGKIIHYPSVPRLGI